jgi:hypothetical protein
MICLNLNLLVSKIQICPHPSPAMKKVLTSNDSLFCFVVFISDFALHCHNGATPTSPSLYIALIGLPTRTRPRSPLSPISRTQVNPSPDLSSVVWRYYKFHSNATKPQDTSATFYLKRFFPNTHTYECSVWIVQCLGEVFSPMLLYQVNSLYSNYSTTNCMQVQFFTSGSQPMANKACR